MNKEKYKHPSIDKIQFENLNFSWAFLALGVMLLLSFFPWQKKMVIDVYYLFFSVSLMLSTAFVKDFFGKRKFRYFVYIVISIALPGFAFYTMILSPLTVQTSIFWNCSLLLTLFFLPVNLFPFSVLLGIILGTLGFVVAGNSFVHPFEDCFLIIIQTGLFFLVWHFIYKEKENRHRDREEVLKENAIMMNHEFRTYLSTIQLNIDTLRKKPEKQKVISASIEKSVRHMSVFLELLQGNFKGYFTTSSVAYLDIKKEVDNVLDAYSFCENEQNLVNVDGNPFPVLIDVQVLRHVLFNLLKNALYFIKKANKGKIHISFNTEGGHKLLIFEDTGYGIRDDVIDHIFDRFYSRNKTGTGMGLYFCKKALKAFDASITCTSEFGKYTRFIIAFEKEPMQ